MDRLKIFEEELNYIQNNKLKEFIGDCLLEAPEYFFHIPASSSGKYHPYNDLGEGGLIRHTKAVVQVALDLIRCGQFNLASDYQDEIVSACILHDIIKNGYEDCGHTVIEHPLLSSDFIGKIYKKYKEEKDYYKIWTNKNCIQHLIETHMGIWNKDKDGNEVLPLVREYNTLGKLVHLADYIASRKYVDINLLKTDIR